MPNNTSFLSRLWMSRHLWFNGDLQAEISAQSREAGGCFQTVLGWDGIWGHRDRSERGSGKGLGCLGVEGRTPGTAAAQHRSHSAVGGPRQHPLVATARHTRDRATRGVGRQHRNPVFPPYSASCLSSSSSTAPSSCSLRFPITQVNYRPFMPGSCVLCPATAWDAASVSLCPSCESHLRQDEAEEESAASKHAEIQSLEGAAQSFQGHLIY